MTPAVRPARRRLAVLVVPFVLFLAACGESGSDGGDTGAIESEPFAGVAVTGELGEAPTVDIAEPPFSVDETTTEVLIEGDGETVAEGDQAVVQYLGVNGRTGEEFDSSWSRSRSRSSRAG